MIKSPKNISGLWFFLLLAISHVTFASASLEFNKGVKFFKQNQYDKALNAFHSAERQGLSTVNLYYNIASSYFKKEQYQQAFYYFKKVHQFPKMKTLAEFNLGLTARKMRKTKEANKWFKKVAKQNENQKLKLIAQQVVGSTNLKRTSSKKWSVYSSFALNAQSNPSFSATDAVAIRGDSNTEILLVADYRLSKKRKNVLKAEVAYYRADYSTLSVFNYSELDVGINKAFSLHKKLGLQVFANAKNSSLSNTGYQNTIKLATNLNVLMSKNSLVLLRYSLDSISNINVANSRLDGTRHKFKLQYALYNKGASHKFITQYEINNRKDLTTATGTKSYSPKRITLRYKYSKKLAKHWRLVTDVSYRNSNYPALSFAIRTDDRIKMSGYVDYKLSKSAKIRAKLAYTSNNSTDNALDYVNNVSSIYFIKTF